MWDSSSPLQLLKTMPTKLGKENLEKIQLIIDADKYKNSLISGFDLCGMYAPFCRGCKKTSIYPCAIAYINMLKAEGMELEIDAKPIAAPKEKPAEPVAEEQKAPHVQAAETPNTEIQTAPENAEIKTEVSPVTDIPPVEEEVKQPEQTVPPAVDLTAEKPQVKRKIRIAVARKKI